MKKLVFLGACLLALASAPARAQTGGADVVVVRVVDGVSTRSKLVVVRGEGKSEEIDLNAGISSKALVESGEALRRTIAQLQQEGYSLKSTFSGSQGYVATLIFIKEK